MLNIDDIQTLVDNEPNYHNSFYALKPKPRELYALGNLQVLDKKILWVVGPRKMSVYADQVMRDFFVSVAQYDLVTISWGANGVDTMCHELSLQHGLPTIVVLWAWFPYYLRSRRSRTLLACVVEAGGLILSQFPNSQEGTPRTFPARNKIIAWLSRVLFVPAAGEKSWSLLTVDNALDFGKPVYSVPQSIYNATSFSTNTYIEAGKIQPICSFAPMLSAYFTAKDEVAPSEDEKKPATPLTLDEQQLLELLTQGPCEVSALCEQLQRPIEKVLGAITGLELQGRVQESGGGFYKHL